MADDPKNLIRTKRLAKTAATRIKHPLNPNAEVFIHRLADQAGLKRAILHLARVPPGKESFVPHHHNLEEEFVYILEGEGTALIGEEKFAVGPGDYIGFPTDGTIHHLTNTGTVDLVYLMGGERHDGEVGFFPTLGKIAMFKGDKVRFYDSRGAEELSIGAWFADQG